MPKILHVLLARLHDLHRQHAQTEVEIAAVESQILASAKPEPKPRRKRSTHAEVVEVVRATVKVLRDANEPLPRREIASRLGIAPWAATYRLKKAMELTFVEKVGTRYRAADTVPSF